MFILEIIISVKRITRRTMTKTATMTMMTIQSTQFAVVCSLYSPLPLSHSRSPVEFYQLCKRYYGLFVCLIVKYKWTMCKWRWTENGNTDTDKWVLGTINYSKDHMPNQYKHQQILSPCKWSQMFIEIHFNSIQFNRIESNACIWDIARGQQVICCPHQTRFFGSHSFEVAAVYHQSTESALLSSNVNHQPRAQLNSFFILFKTGNEKEWSSRLKRMRRNQCKF